MINYQDIFENEAYSYTTYRKLVDELLAEGKTTSDDHSDELLQYAKVNVQRMNRGDKTVTLSDELLQIIAQIKIPINLLVITEGWCGDAAQIVPVFNKIAEAADGNIKLKFVLRDKNLPLIDAHLTNGGRAIPVLLVLNEKGELLLPKWGPRPSALQTLMLSWKQDGLAMPELGEQLHGWYAKDKTKTIQTELVSYFKQLL